MSLRVLLQTGSEVTAQPGWQAALHPWSSLAGPGLRPVNVPVRQETWKAERPLSCLWQPVLPAFHRNCPLLFLFHLAWGCEGLLATPGLGAVWCSPVLGTGRWYSTSSPPSNDECFIADQQLQQRENVVEATLCGCHLNVMGRSQAQLWTYQPPCVFRVGEGKLFSCGSQIQGKHWSLCQGDDTSSRIWGVLSLGVLLLFWGRGVALRQKPKTLLVINTGMLVQECMLVRALC